MDSFFQKLGDTVLTRWKRENFSLEKFPGIAVDELQNHQPAGHVDLEKFLRAFLLDDSQPSQTESGFGEPEIIVYENPRFYIQLLFWMDGTTAIHQHEFSGAFHVMSGSSIHAQFAFENETAITPHFRVGDLRMRDISLLETGCTVPIVSGRSCIHSLFHLDTPSITVVVRTQHDPGTGPQFNYLPPHIAYDPVFSDPLTLRRRQVLDVLEQMQDPAYVDLVLEMIQELDFERGFHTLQNCMAHLRDSGAWERVYAAFQEKHGSPALGIEATLDECTRRDRIKAMRARISDPDHRFFLALLLNVRTRGDLYSLVARRFPGESVVDVIMRWSEELLEETDCGVAILDAGFPQELDVDFDEQPTVFLTVLRKILDADFKVPSGFPKDALEPIRSAFAESCLALLVG
jgi:hypothetical protein